MTKAHLHLHTRTVRIIKNLLFIVIVFRELNLKATNGSRDSACARTRSERRVNPEKAAASCWSQLCWNRNSAFRVQKENKSLLVADNMCTESSIRDGDGSSLLLCCCCCPPSPAGRSSDNIVGKVVPFRKI